MASLQSILTADDVRPTVADRCAQLVDSEVSNKSGLSGIAIKAAYKVVQKVKPGMVRDVANKLLPEFAEAIDPMYQESLGQAEGSGSSPASSFEKLLNTEQSRAADALLGVTDARIGSARPAIRKAYEKLRGTAKQHVTQAVPGLARAIAEFI